MGYNIDRFLGKGNPFAYEAYEAITERNIKSSELGITARNLNYYKTQGLFFSETKFEKHDHIKFNFTEYVWFNLILDLRKFDIGLNTIRNIRELLESSFPMEEFLSVIGFSEKFISKLPDNVREEYMEIMHSDIDLKEVEKEVPVNLLSFILVEIIVKRKNAALLVNSEGDFFPFSFEDYDELCKDEPFAQFIEQTYVSVSITEIIKGFITNFDLSIYSDRLMLLTEREAQIIKILRDEKLESLTVHLDDKKTIHLIETKESYNKLDKESRLLDLMIKNGYQTLEIKTQDGRIVYCKNIKKIAMKK
jgi:DNA-binding transcriptional MerR regulator